MRTRYPNCPLPTCPNPKDRAKRLHNIPARLYELAPDVRDPIMQEFQIPAQATRCCSACLMRIRRKLDPHINLTDEDRRTDGDESDVSTSSCDEREPGGSDTASVESPENPQRHNSLTKDLVQKPSSQMVANMQQVGLVTGAGSGTNSTSTQDSAPVSSVVSGVAGVGVGGAQSITIVKSDERLLPPLGHAPKKQKTSEEYDSSATETADEENENSPANRQSPKVILNSANSSSSSSVVVSSASGLGPPPSSVNGPIPPPATTASTAADLQDFLFTVIERSLKHKGPPPTNKPSNQAPTSQQQHNAAMANKQQQPAIRLSVESSPNNNRRNDIISSSTNSSSSSNSNTNNNNNNSNNDVMLVREYRNDGSIKHQPQAHGQPILTSVNAGPGGGSSLNTMQNINMRQSQPQPSQQVSSNVSAPPGHPENLATLSVVNSYIPGQHLMPPGGPGIMHHQQHDIKATITPVLKSGKTSTPPHVVAPPPPETIIYPTSRNNEPEPQTLDLSIKKPSRDGPSPHNSSSMNTSSSSSTGDNGVSRHQQPPSSSAVKHVGNAPSMYRGSEPTTLIGAPPNHAYGYHPHVTNVGVGKVPPPGSLYVSQVPVPMSITQPPPGVPVSSGSGRGGQSSQAPSSQPPPSHMQLSGQHVKSVGGVNKMPPKLSPQLIHPPPSSHGQAPSPSQQQQQQQQLLGGPKGSITHGTPVNNAAQQIIVHSATAGATLSPKFDTLLRQTPPSGAGPAESNKLGSITQGTPIHLPAHLDNKRAYEYAYKSSQRQSPAQQLHAPPSQQQSSPQAPPQNAYAVGTYSRGPYTVEQPPVLSTRQIVMHDYITSQQMQGQQQRSVPRSGSANSAGAPGSGKESPSPRNNTSGLVYYDKDRGRTEYSSRASPAEHSNR